MRNLVRITVVAVAWLMPTGGFAAQRSGIDSAGAGRLVQMCDEGSRDIAGLPVEQYRTIPADDAQRAALEDLATATVKAGQGIKAACPAETPLRAPAASPPCRRVSRRWSRRSLPCGRRWRNSTAS